MNFSFISVSSIHCRAAVVWIFSTTVFVTCESASVCVSTFSLCIYSCSYSQCGLPWFQGMTSPIPPISGASLRDVLGSLMLSIVGGTKPLPVSLIPTSISPQSSLLFLFILPVTTDHFTLLISAQWYMGFHWLTDRSLLPNCLRWTTQACV